MRDPPGKFVSVYCQRSQVIETTELLASFFSADMKLPFWYFPSSIHLFCYIDENRLTAEGVEFLVLNLKTCSVANELFNESQPISKTFSCNDRPRTYRGRSNALFAQRQMINSVLDFMFSCLLMSPKHVINSVFDDVSFSKAQYFFWLQFSGAITDAEFSHRVWKLSYGFIDSHNRKDGENSHSFEPPVDFGFFLTDITDSSSSIRIFSLYISFLLHLLFIKILIQSRSH